MILGKLCPLIIVASLKAKNIFKYVQLNAFEKGYSVKIFVKIEKRWFITGIFILNPNPTPSGLGTLQVRVGGGGALQKIWY